MKSMFLPLNLRARVFAGIVFALSLLVFGADAPAAPPKGDGRELLSEHQTVARFDGVAYQQCRGLTALCPDKCGSSGDFASFNIVGYLFYKKPGEYGDPMQERFTFQVEDNMKNAKVSAELLATLKGLKKDDYVLLSWNHDYVTKAGSSSPERPVTKVGKITKDEAEKLLKQKK
jgi:hypothetical protein